MRAKQAATFASIHQSGQGLQPEDGVEGPDHQSLHRQALSVADALVLLLLKLATRQSATTSHTSPPVSTHHPQSPHITPSLHTSPPVSSALVFNTHTMHTHKTYAHSHRHKHVHSKHTHTQARTHSHTLSHLSLLGLPVIKRTSPVVPIKKNLNKIKS